MAPKFKEGDIVRPSRAGGAGKAFKVDGYVKDAFDKLYVAISDPFTGKGLGCMPYRSLRAMTPDEWKAHKDSR